MAVTAKRPDASWSMTDLRASGFTAKFAEFAGGDVLVGVEGGELTIRRNDAERTLLGRYKVPEARP